MGQWTARQIWKTLDRDTRATVALSLWEDERLDRHERAAALVPWMAARGVRVAYLEKLSKARRASLIAEGGIPEDTGVQLLMSFHLVHRRALLACFLDELGIEHEDGIITDGAEVEAPDAEKAAKAIGTLRERFEEEHVLLYLKTLTATDALTWAAIAETLDDPE